MVWLAYELTRPRGSRSGEIASNPPGLLWQDFVHDLERSGPGQLHVRSHPADETDLADVGVRGPRKVLRRVPSALRCPHPETSQKRPTQRMRGPFSRLTDSWVPPDPRRSPQRASKPPEDVPNQRRSVAAVR